MSALPQCHKPGRHLQADTHFGRHNPRRHLPYPGQKPPGRHPPPRREMVNKRLICILLECILVSVLHFPVNYEYKTVVDCQLVPVYCTTYLDLYVFFLSYVHCLEYSVVDLHSEILLAPPGSKFFQFIAVFGKFWQNHMSHPPMGTPGSATDMIVPIMYL